MDIFELVNNNNLSKAEAVIVSGEKFYIRRLNANDRDVMEEQWLSFRDTRKAGEVGGLRGFTVAFCLSDKDGNKTYDSGFSKTPKKEFLDVVERMSELPIEYINSLWNKAAHLNKMTSDDVEELEKN